MPKEKFKTKNSRAIETNKDSKLFAELIAGAALEKKAEEIRILNLAGLTDIADHFVIASGSSSLHVKAIADHVRDEADPSSKPWHIEGYDNLKWVLLDYVDVVMHIFDKDTRRYYDLERLWADAEITTVSDEE